MTSPQQDETSPTTLQGLHVASELLRETVHRLDDRWLREPSLLPGWSRAHVVAHLILNADGTTRAAEGLMVGDPIAIYDSSQARDQEIEELATADRHQLRTRLRHSCDVLQDTLSRVPEELMDESVERTPGGPRFPVASLLPTRRREVEIHHVDLGVDYVPADWPTDFVVELIDTLVADRADETPFHLHATDLGLQRDVGTGEPQRTVYGRGHDLGWWLTARRANELGADPEPLPTLSPWVRRTR